MVVLEVEALFKTVGGLLSRSRGSSGHLVSHSEFLGSDWGMKGYYSMPYNYLSDRDLTDDF